MTTTGVITGSLVPTGARLALATVNTGVMIQKGAEQHCLQINADAADLSLLNRHAPFLCEHRHYIEELLGDIREAWIHDGTLYAVVRFCHLDRANLIWSLLEQEYPIGASLGYDVLECHPVEGTTDPVFIVDKWRATEISACVLVGGADPNARISWRPFSELAELTQQHRAARAEMEQARRELALKADSWRHWAQNGAATQIAEAVGVAEDRLAGPLASAVEDHLRQLSESVQ